MMNLNLYDVKTLEIKEPETKPCGKSEATWIDVIITTTEGERLELTLFVDPGFRSRIVDLGDFKDRRSQPRPYPNAPFQPRINEEDYKKMRKKYE